MKITILQNPIIFSHKTFFFKKVQLLKYTVFKTMNMNIKKKFHELLLQDYQLFHAYLLRIVWISCMKKLYEKYCHY